MSEILLKMYDLMSQSAKSRLGIMPAPEEKDVRKALEEYFLEKDVKPEIGTMSMSEMMTLISDIVHNEIYAHR